jgi:hypothetical protein
MPHEIDYAKWTRVQQFAIGSTQAFSGGESWANDARESARNVLTSRWSAYRATDLGPRFLITGAERGTCVPSEQRCGVRGTLREDELGAQSQIDPLLLRLSNA